jgi:hypothetical protein
MNFKILIFEPSGFTEPLMVNLIGSCITLVVIVISLLKGPTLLVSYLTEIELVSLGLIGFSGLLAVVQPQDVPTFVIIAGVFPVFLNSNEKVSSAPYVIPFRSIV